MLRELQAKHDLAYLFISHDLKVVRALANEIIVMRNGKVVEQGPAKELFSRRKEDYTKALLAAAFNIEAVKTAPSISECPCLPKSPIIVDLRFHPDQVREGLKRVPGPRGDQSRRSGK
ncbi:MAG: hypothetical protein QM811_03290 [Pirellulales bacterium]